MSDCFKPVSYTHLDVYKRQGLILLYLLKHRCCILFCQNIFICCNKCQKQHNTNKQTQPKKQKRRERFIFLLSFSIRSISFMLFSITSCPVSVILIMHIHFTFHLRLYKYYEGDSNFILKILICWLQSVFEKGKQIERIVHTLYLTFHIKFWILRNGSS